MPQDILDRVERGDHSGNIVGIKVRVNEEKVMFILTNLLISSFFSKPMKKNSEKDKKCIERKGIIDYFSLMTRFFLI